MHKYLQTKLSVGNNLHEQNNKTAANQNFIIAQRISRADKTFWRVEKSAG